MQDEERYAKAIPKTIPIAERTQTEQMWPAEMSDRQTVWLASFIQASDDAFIGNDPDNRIVSWNFGAERMFGYTPQEAIGQPMSLLVPSDRNREPEQILCRIEQGERSLHIETVRVTKDWRRLVVSLIAMPAPGPTGITGVLTILRDITEQKRVERELVQKLLLAQEEERRILAYELHDGLAQYIMTSHLNLETFCDRYRVEASDRFPHSLEKGMRYIEQAIMEVRRLINGLRALALDDLGLVGALEDLLAEEKERAGWQDAGLAHNLSGLRFDIMLETAAYRVAQEALTNAGKHAEASRVQVQLRYETPANADKSWLELIVQDWGRGFAPQEQAPRQGHLGLHSMEERVRMLDGSFALQSVPGQGTRVHAVFPVAQIRDSAQ